MIQILESEDDLLPANHSEIHKTDGAFRAVLQDCGRPEFKAVQNCGPLGSKASQNCNRFGSEADISLPETYLNTV